MNPLEINSTFLIQSSQNGSFGTGFVIYVEGNRNYLLTCTHVVEACGEESLLVNTRKAMLLAKGESDNIDLAVLVVDDLGGVALPLNQAVPYEGMPFSINGFKRHNPNYKLEELEGKIKKTSKIQSREQSIDIYELALDSNENIERGYSGAGIVGPNGSVIAVAISRYNQEHADAISIKYLADIWDKMPFGLISERVLLKPKSSFKKFFKIKYFLSFLLSIFLLLFIPRYLEEEKLNALKDKVGEVSYDWKEKKILNVKIVEKERISRANSKDKALKLLPLLQEIDDDYLISFESKGLKYTFLSYVYGVASYLSEDRDEQKKLARKSIENGRVAQRIILNHGASESTWSNDVELIILMSYSLILCEPTFGSCEKDSALLLEAKQAYTKIKAWYLAPNYQDERKIDMVNHLIKTIDQ
jgi:hypothetical protein